MFSQIDPVICITDKKIENERKTLFHFLFPFCFTVFVVFYGIFGLHYQATGEWLTSFTDYSLSPYVYIHQASPRAVWSQMDIALGSIDGTATSIIFLALAFTQKKLKTKFTFFLLHTTQNEKPTTKVFINGHCLSKMKRKNC